MNHVQHLATRKIGRGKKDKSWAPAGLGSNARLTHNRLFPGRPCCCDVTDPSRAFSQHAGPGAIMDKSGRPRLTTLNALEPTELQLVTS